MSRASTLRFLNADNRLVLDGYTARQNEHTKACSSIPLMPLHTLMPAPRGDTCAPNPLHLMAFPKARRKKEPLRRGRFRPGWLFADWASPCPRKLRTDRTMHTLSARPTFASTVNCAVGNVRRSERA